MPYRIAKSFVVESGHILSKHPGACRFPHGHSRTVEIVLVADTLDARDMVCDFKALKLAVADHVNRYDHALALNTEDPHFARYRESYGDRIIPFRDQDPTSEVMAREIFLFVRDALAKPSPDPRYPLNGNVRVERVRVTETATSWAEYGE